MAEDVIRGRALVIIDSLCTALLEVGKRWAEAQRELAEAEQVIDALRRREGARDLADRARPDEGER